MGQAMKYEDLCSTCENLKQCELWLRLMRSDNSKDLETYGFRTITLVYDCKEYKELTPKPKNSHK